MRHVLNVLDEQVTQDAVNDFVHIDRYEYIVLTYLNKHGKTYEPGEPIMLDENTAQLFIEAKEIREAKK
jgi:hypothetical protein